MYRLVFMVMYQQKLEQVTQVVLLTIFAKMQAATAFRVSVVLFIVVFRLVVVGFWMMVLVLVLGVSAVRLVILHWNLNNDSGNSNWNIGGSHYYRSVYTLRALKLETGTHKHII